MKTIEQLQQEIEVIMHNDTLTYPQKTDALAKYAQNILDYPEGTPAEFFEMMASEEICDLDEGHGPFSPRYILPDYAKFFAEGSKFLRIDPPKDLLEACNDLLIFYHNAHCVDRFPVFIGRLDVLLEPFVKKLNDRELAKKIIANFLNNVDRTMWDSFVQANIGPEASETGEIILELLPELKNITPNMTLRYDPQITPDSFAEKALVSALHSANPAFAYDPFYKERVGENYGIASCYNGLLIGGGAFTLTRLRLGTIALHSDSYADFFERKLPEAIRVQLAFMDGKIRNVVEERSFFQDDWMVKEGFVSKDRFVGLFGIVGLCECCNVLMEKQGKQGKYGPDEEANQLGVRIMDLIEKAVMEHHCPYSYKNHFVLHAQVGIGSDTFDSPGARIKIGEELDLYPHLKQAGLFHHYFPSGVGDIFPFDETALRNPSALLDIFKGGFASGCTYLSTYLGNGDLIRVTGYLIKKSEVDKIRKGETVHNQSAVLVIGMEDNGHLLDRKVRSL